MLSCLGIEQFFSRRYKDWSGGDQFDGTGERLERMIEEMCWTNSHIEEEVGKSLKVFEDSYDGMLVSRGIDVWTLCPHHLLPCNFRVHVGYIPTGKVLGLSKFTRIAVVMGKRPVIQEQYTRELADILWKNLSPDGLGVYVTGRHGCMGCRGVKQGVDIITSDLRGSFREDKKTREEFYEICR